MRNYIKALSEEQILKIMAGIYDRYTEKAIWLKEEDIPVLPDNSSLTVIFLEGARFTDGEKMIWTLYDESDKTIKGNHDYPVLTPGFDLKKQITAKENITQTDAIRIINIVSEQLPFYDLVLGRNKARRIY